MSTVYWGGDDELRMVVYPRWDRWKVLVQDTHYSATECHTLLQCSTPSHLHSLRVGVAGMKWDPEIPDGSWMPN